MPWEATRLRVAPIEPDGTLGPSDLAAGGPDESIAQPEWSADGTLHLVSDRTGLVEPVPAGRGPAAGADRPDGGRVRRPGLDLRSLVVRLPRRRLRSWPWRARRATIVCSTSSRACRSARSRRRSPSSTACRSAPTPSSSSPGPRTEPTRRGPPGPRDPRARSASCVGRARSRSTRRPSRGRRRSTSRRAATGRPMRSSTRHGTRCSRAARRATRRWSSTPMVARRRTPRRRWTCASSA